MDAYWSLDITEMKAPKQGVETASTRNGYMHFHPYQCRTLTVSYKLTTTKHQYTSSVLKNVFSL